MKISIKRSNDYILQFTLFTIPVTDGVDGTTTTPVDLTNSTVYFTVKPQKDKHDQDDTDAVINKDITSHVNVVTGETQVTLDKTDTDIEAGSYLFNIKYKDPNGLTKESDVYPFIVEDGITKRI